MPPIATWRITTTHRHRHRHHPQTCTKYSKITHAIYMKPPLEPQENIHSKEMKEVEKENTQKHHHPQGSWRWSSWENEKNQSNTHPHHTPQRPPRHSTATARPQKKESVTQKVTPPRARRTPASTGRNLFRCCETVSWWWNFFGWRKNDYTGYDIGLHQDYTNQCSHSNREKVCVGGCSGPGCRRAGSMAGPWSGGGVL